MKTKIAKGQEKYIVKIVKLAKQEEKVRILNLIIDEEKKYGYSKRYEQLKTRINGGSEKIPNGK